MDHDRAENANQTRNRSYCRPGSMLPQNRSRSAAHGIVAPPVPPRKVWSVWA